MRCIIILLLSMVLICPSARAHESELKAYITDFMVPISKTRVYKKRLRKALELVPVIIEQSWAHQVDPLLVAVTISYESSWDPSVLGKRGELNLMQIMPGHKDHEGWPLADGRVSIAAGVERLGNCLKACETLPGALTRYGTGGSCRPIARFVK